MVKPINIKPNIIQRRHLSKHPQATSSGGFPKDKGEFEGHCNRSACLKPGATWYNHSTRKYYCGSCAHDLNYDSFNRREAMITYGHLLCTAGKYNSDWSYALDQSFQDLLIDKNLWEDERRLAVWLIKILQEAQFPLKPKFESKVKQGLFAYYGMRINFINPDKVVVDQRFKHVLVQCIHTWVEKHFSGKTVQDLEQMGIEINLYTPEFIKDSVLENMND